MKTHRSGSLLRISVTLLSLLAAGALAYADRVRWDIVSVGTGVLNPGGVASASANEGFEAHDRRFRDVHPGAA